VINATFDNIETQHTWRK